MYGKILAKLVQRFKETSTVSSGEYGVNGFERMKAALQDQGWYVGWCEGWSQSDAWDAVPYDHEVGPFKGQRIDTDKCLFNHEQDAQIYWEDDVAVELEEQSNGDPAVRDAMEVTFFEQLGETDRDNWHTIFSNWDMKEIYFKYLFNREWYSFPWYGPTEISQSYFCFGSAQALKEVIPLIEECGCKVTWNGRSDTRPLISWG